jgi:hypothetical protein
MADLLSRSLAGFGRELPSLRVNCEACFAFSYINIRAIDSIKFMQTAAYRPRPGIDGWPEDVREKPKPPGRSSGAPAS